MQQTILITGANRGIGLEFTRQYLDTGNQMIACCRHPEQATTLQQLMQNHPTGSIVALDVSSQTSIEHMKTTIGQQPIDILINNAGIAGVSDQKLGHFDPDNFINVMRVNVMGVILVTQALLPNLLNSQFKTIAAVSSTSGSIAENTSGSRFAYRSSKAALNAILRSMSIDLEAQGIAVIALSPGWVKTDMGGENAPLAAKDSVQQMRKFISERQTISKVGLIHYDGRQIPW